MPTKTANGNVASPPASASPIGTVPVGNQSAPIPPRFLSSNHSVRSAGDAGDIILGEEKPKGKIFKKPLIIGVISVVAVAIIVTGVVLFFQNINARRTKVVQTFDTYFAYLNNAPTDLLSESEKENLESSWSLFDLPESHLPMSIRKEYAVTLQADFDAFAEAVEEVAFKNSGEEQLSEQLGAYREFLTVSIGYATLGVIKAEILSVYNESGADIAQEYVDNLFPAEFDNQFVSTFATGMEAYLTAELDMMVIYGENDCIENGAIDYTCVVWLEKDEPAFVVAGSEANNWGRNLDSMSGALAVAFQTATDHLKIMVEEIYYE